MGDRSIEFGTDLVRTVVRPAAGGWTVERVAGPARPEGLRAPVPLPPLRAGGMRIGWPEAGRHRWTVPAHRSLAFAMLAGDPPVEAELADVGRLLRAVHALDPPPGLRPPAGVLRWRDWLAGTRGPGAADRLHALAGTRCGPRRLGLLTDWADAQLSAPARLAHGAPGLASLYPGVLLAGDELAAGPPVGDLAWLVGELDELAARGVPACAGLRRALVAGYGPVDPAELDRYAAVRVLGHTVDFAAYVGWHPQLTGQLDLVGQLVDRAAGAQRR